MEFKFTNANRNCKRVWSALFLAAIFCNMLATLDWLYLLPATLLGVLLPMFPITENRKVRFLLFGMLAMFTLFRFVSILDGMKLLANRMFVLSEETQSYQYIIQALYKPLIISNKESGVSICFIFGHFLMH